MSNKLNFKFFFIIKLSLGQIVCAQYSQNVIVKTAEYNFLN